MIASSMHEAPSSARPQEARLAAARRGERMQRRLATRREVVLPCQAVRLSDFSLIADRTLDVSVDGLLVPSERPVSIGDAMIVSFPIPGLWIDAEATVTRIVRGRRPGDDGKAAVGLAFDVIAPSVRAALAGFLHGRPPPLPRRGPLGRLRRGAPPPQLADASLMEDDAPLEAETIARGAGRTSRIDEVDLADILDDDDILVERIVAPPPLPRLRTSTAAIDGLEVLRAVVDAWRNLRAPDA